MRKLKILLAIKYKYNKLFFFFIVLLGNVTLCSYTPKNTILFTFLENSNTLSSIFYRLFAIIIVWTFPVKVFYVETSPRETVCLCKFSHVACLSACNWIRLQYKTMHMQSFNDNFKMQNTRSISFSFFLSLFRFPRSVSQQYLRFVLVPVTISKYWEAERLVVQVWFFFLLS